ncbi:MAG: DUF58 domain-containing protein [Deltaproteobacteria bacterium]|nr:DUF58 domain-containing protein [Deltaproteobacteria bacterium]
MLARDLLRKIRKIEIYTNRLVNDQLAGQYHSVFKGRGMAFAEVRQYQPGDDIRLIDWNVSARMNDVFIKLFSEEREMTVMLLVDMSASNLFGTYSQTKRDLTAEIAAILAFSAIKNNDRVGLIIFTDEVEKFVPPKKGKKHVLRVISEILSYRPKSRRTDLASGLEFLGRITKRRSVAFILTDFLQEPPRDLDLDPRDPPKHQRLEHAFKVISRKHDLIPVTVTDPLEEELPPMGLVTLTDYETGDQILFDSSGPEARAFAMYQRRSREARHTLFRRLKMDYMALHTNEPYVRKLVDFFRARAARMHRR